MQTNSERDLPLPQSSIASTQQSRIQRARRQHKYTKTNISPPLFRTALSEKWASMADRVADLGGRHRLISTSFWEYGAGAGGRWWSVSVRGAVRGRRCGGGGGALCQKRQLVQLSFACPAVCVCAPSCALNGAKPPSCLAAPSAP